MEEKGLDPSQKWGNYPPATRKALRTIEEYLQSPTVAKQVANAIDLEYTPRYRSKKIKKEHILTYHCKKCGESFRRRSWGNESREYCDQCLRTGPLRGEENPKAKLTQEQAEEIRHLNATGKYKYRELAEMYGIKSISSIGKIVRNISYNPNAPMDMWLLRKSGENSHEAKLTWEKVDEIKRLKATEYITYKKLAEMYDISKEAIADIINERSWKPEHDPRRKESTP